jgi:TIR domain
VPRSRPSLQDSLRAHAQGSGFQARELAVRLGIDEEAASAILEPGAIIYPLALAKAAIAFDIDLDDIDSAFRYASLSRDDTRRFEKELAEVGADFDYPLRMRLCALGALPQTDVDPWLDEHFGYQLILQEKRYPLEERLEIAHRLTAYGDPMLWVRYQLYEQALTSDEFPLATRASIAVGMQMGDDYQMDHPLNIKPKLLALRKQLYRSIFEQECENEVEPDLRLRMAEQLAGRTGVLALAKLHREERAQIASRARNCLILLAMGTDQPADVRHLAFQVLRAQMSNDEVTTDKHVFISYVRDDQATVERLANDLETLGLHPWLDVRNLKPGQRWRRELRDAIRGGSAFIAVFSDASERRERSYMRQELIEAVDELQLRPAERAWFFPVVLSSCVTLPTLRIGPGEDLRDIQYVSLASEWKDNVAKLAAEIHRVLA